VFFSYIFGSVRFPKLWTKYWAFSNNHKSPVFYYNVVSGLVMVMGSAGFTYRLYRLQPRGLRALGARKWWKRANLELMKKLLISLGPKASKIAGIGKH
jgi:hypothetical protein